MAGKTLAARKPVLSDMSDDDNAAFEAMRTGNAPAPAPEPEAQAAPEAAPEEQPKPQAAKPETAPAAPAPGEKPAATAPEQPEGSERDTRMVPHGALHEERERRKERERELQQEREQTRVLTDRLARLAAAIEPKLEAPQPQPDQAPEIPDPEKDPVAYIKATYPLVRQIQQERAQGQQRQVQATAQQRVISEAVNHAVTGETSFRETAPDYDKAADYLKASRAQELSEAGVPPMAIAQQIQNETVQLAVMARQTGRNFGQVVYNMAKARGYAIPAPTPAPQPAPAPGAQAPASAPSEQERIEMVRKGQQQSQSLSNATGAAPKPALTAEKLATMSDQEFASVLSKLSESQQRQIFGR